MAIVFTCVMYNIKSSAMKPVSNPTLTQTFRSLHSAFLQCKAPRRSHFALSHRAVFGGNIISVAISTTASGNITSVAYWYLFFGVNSHSDLFIGLANALHLKFHHIHASLAKRCV